MMQLMVVERPSRSLGDDNITISSKDPSLASGGKGNDSISSTAVANANSKAHSIDGGVGIDSSPRCSDWCSFCALRCRHLYKSSSVRQPV